MQHEDDDSQNDCGDYHRQCNPRNPLSRPQEKFFLPWSISVDGRDDDYLRVRYDTFHVDVMFVGMLRRADKQILNVVIGPSEPKVGIRCEKRLVAGLWELSHCKGAR